DTVVTGRKTFDQSLSFSRDPFMGKQTFVFSRSEVKSVLPRTEYIRKDPVEFTRSLKAGPGRKIWLVGGAQINGLLVGAGLIDEIIMSIHPVALGRGVHLFGQEGSLCDYRLADSQVFESGLVQLSYMLRS
ncbi:MAG: dihydrofolate reductase family protein, partial [Nitrospinota bacterium]|nr:dihydrofolate reductase family protein [Nitrospinota bacterium]